VARQYSGTLGKVGNCQVAVSVHAASDAASAPLDWRLYVPERWDQRCAADTAAAAARGKRCAIPDTEHHRPKWQMALEMIDELIEWGRIPPVVIADAGYGDTTALRQGRTDRQIGYVVAVKGATSAYPGDATPQTAPYAGRGRPPTPHYRDPRQSCRDLAMAAGRTALKTVTWRHGTKTDPDNPAAAMRSRFLALRIRPATRHRPSRRRQSSPKPGCSPHGPPVPTNPATTGSAPSAPTHPSRSVCAWPRSAGASNTTTEN
jgi:SRSO17 transposase